MMKKLKWAMVPAIILTLFLLVQTTGVQLASAVSDNSVVLNHQPAKTSLTNTAKNQEDQTLTHEEVTYLSNKFMDLLVQETDESLKVIDYNSKDELLNAFKKIASSDVAASFVDFYYRETKEGLYIVPTATPPWLNNENDYDMIQLNDNMVKVVQENNTELYGTYTITMEFTYKNGWKISKVNYS